MREDLRTEARLAFERLVVSAIVRIAAREGDVWADAYRRLPGRRLAETALRAGEPLDRANFLKGQSVNGPFGVMARLSRRLELVDDEDRLGRGAVALLHAWEEGEDLPGLLDEEGGAALSGGHWMASAVRATVDNVGRREWPGDGAGVWSLLAVHLRSDEIGTKERREILKLLEGDATRCRVLNVLRECAGMLRRASEGGRGAMEREVLLRGIRPRLGGSTLDRKIAAAIAAIEVYEQTAGRLQHAFEWLVWGLREHGGRSGPHELLQDSRVRTGLDRVSREIGRLAHVLQAAAQGLQNYVADGGPALADPLLHLREEAVAASASATALAETVFARHERVQREKRKAAWIERDLHWTLMPGENRVALGSRPAWMGYFVHSFRVANAYSLLADLGHVRFKDEDAEG